MTINKFTGKTQEEAIEKAKAEFGPELQADGDATGDHFRHQI